MIPCRECKKEISSEAKTCPHCGIGSPQRSLLSRRFGDLPLLTRLAIVFIGAPIFLGVIINLFSPSTPDSSSSPPPPSETTPTQATASMPAQPPSLPAPELKLPTSLAGNKLGSRLSIENEWDPQHGIGGFCPGIGFSDCPQNRGTTFSKPDCAVTFRTHKLFAVEGDFQSELSYDAILNAWTNKYGSPTGSATGCRCTFTGFAEGNNPSLQCSIWENSKIRLALYKAPMGIGVFAVGETLVNKTLESLNQEEIKEAVNSELRQQEKAAGSMDTE